MELTIEQSLQQGVTAHKEGKFQDAERLYKAILQSQPLHPDANHNLGVLAVSVNKASAALPLFKVALEANPKIEQFWLSYIDALIKEQQFEAAKQVIQQAKKQGVAEEKLNILEAKLASINEPKLAVPNKSLSLSQQRNKLSEQKKQKKATKQNLKANIPSQSQLSSLLEHYRAGRLDDAEKLATSITQQFPEHQFAWKVLGIVYGQTGRNSKAVDANQEAVALSPQDPEAHNNLGNTLQELGRLEEAEASYTQAIALKPDYAEAHNNLGVTLKELGRLDEAEARYTQAIALKPDYALAHSNLGNILQELGRLDEAEASYTQAIALQPDYAEAHSNLGVTLQQMGRLNEAEASSTHAIVLKPDHANAHSNLGAILKELGRLEEAEASCRKSIALKADYAEAYNNLGGTLQKMGRFDEAQASYTQAIAFKPDYAEAHNNLGAALQELGRIDEAQASYTKAIALKPDFADAHNNLGGTLQALGSLNEAEASYTQAIVLKPDFAQAYSCLGVILYINGDIDSGLEKLEKANNIDATLYDNKIILAILKARKNLGITGFSADNASNLHSSSEQFTQPVILKRAIEAELISSLYKMKSIELDKFDNNRRSDPRFGDGKCSRDFKLFKDESPIIKTVAEELTIIMREVVNSDIYISESFFNIFGAGGGATPHAHIGKLDEDEYLNFGKQKYSLVYYLSVGDQNCMEPGILKLYDPSEDILPYEGMIAIFPADRKHSAVYGGEKDRVMIGVNFYSL